MDSTSVPLCKETADWCGQPLSALGALITVNPGLAWPCLALLLPDLACEILSTSLDGAKSLWL